MHGTFTRWYAPRSSHLSRAIDSCFLAQVIVARKVMLMSVFLLFQSLFAVLLATTLVMISLGMHIFARPFEDAGTNWVEMLTLTSQLFLLVAGPVFKTLVRGRQTRPVEMDC